MIKNYIPTINISSLVKNNFETQNAFKTIKKIETKKGQEKKRAFAVAKGM